MLCVSDLQEYDASVTSRSADGWSCVHDATLCDDEFLLAQVFLRGKLAPYPSLSWQFAVRLQSFT